MHKKLIRVASLLLTALLLLSIPAAVNAENIEETVYTVTLTEDSRVNYSGVSKLSFALQPGSYTNVYANIAEDWRMTGIFPMSPRRLPTPLRSCFIRIPVISLSKTSPPI